MWPPEQPPPPTFLASLHKVSREVRARGSTHVVKVCVVTVLTYGSQAWWVGKKKRGVTAHAVSARLGGLVHALQQVLSKSWRAAVPAWKTTPLPALHLEVGAPLPSPNKGPAW